MRYDLKKTEVERTLLDYLSGFKISKRKRRAKEAEKCRWKILVKCNQCDGSFYACRKELLLDVEEKIKKGCCSNYKSNDCENCLKDNFKCPKNRDAQVKIRKKRNLFIVSLHPLKTKADYSLVKCKCKPIRKIDGEIIERECLNELSKHEPCRFFRCTHLKERGECLKEKEKRMRKDTKQIKLTDTLEEHRLKLDKMN
jgi:hypothetical protein